MSIERKLERWREAGLIDETAIARITAFEASQRKPIVLYALAVLGGGTIALGLVSIVAANWDAIPAGVKLGCDLLIGAALAYATFASAQRAAWWRTEVLVTVFYGFTLASLALVGQVYQLDTPTYQALLVWSVATLPLMLLGRSRYLGALFLCGLVTTHGFCFDALVEHVQHSARIGDAVERNLLTTAAFASPLIYVLLGRLPWLARERPEFARTLNAFAWTAVLVLGFGLQFLWYESIDRGETLDWALAVTLLLAIALAAALPRLYPETPMPAQRSLAAILLLGWLTLALGTSFARGSVAFVGAILQLAWIGLFAFCSLQLGLVRVFNLLTAAIAVRVLVIYFEVFGSLLDTGVGLITGGALTLAIAWFWRRKTRDLAQRLGPGARSGHVA